MITFIAGGIVLLFLLIMAALALSGRLSREEDFFDE